ncbi:MAG: chemotaxis protein CheA [Pirellulales bacterium]
MSENDLLGEMLTDFLDESDDLLIQLNDNLLSLDQWVHTLAKNEQQHYDDEAMNTMFRAAHSLKGLSAMLGLDNINALTHKVENIFDAARNDKLYFNTDIVEVVFQAVDRLEAMIEGLKNPDNVEVEFSEVTTHIQAILEVSGTDKPQKSSIDIDFPSRTADSAEETADENQTAAEESRAAEPVINPLESIQDEDDVPAKYLSIFIDEVQFSLDSLSDTLLAEPNDSTTEDLLITCHRIKGSAASIGLNRVAKLSHYMEDLLQQLRQSGDPVTQVMVDALLHCVDELRNYVKQLQAGGPIQDQFEFAYLELIQVSEPDAATNGSNCQEEASPTGAVTAPTFEPLRTKITTLAPTNGPSLFVVINFQQSLILAGFKANLVVEKAARHGQIIHCDPSQNSLESLDELQRVVLGLATEVSPELLLQELHLEGVESVTVDLIEKEGNPSSSEQDVSQEPTEKVDTQSSNSPQQAAVKKPAATSPKQLVKTATQEKTPAPKKAAAAEKSPTKGAKKPAETLRVDIERLDQLMNLAGQLVINRSRLARIGDRFKSTTSVKQTAQSLEGVIRQLDKIAPEEHTGQQNWAFSQEQICKSARRMRQDLENIRQDITKLAQSKSMVNDLAEAVHELDRVTDGIQKSVMDTRMVPIGPLFTRFKRVIRDITRANGKSIELVIRGEKTELDKRMIDELADPLIHMVRNSADHGVEDPADRLAAGKPEMGQVTLDAFHRGNSIWVQVTDDGKGIDPDKILGKALEKNIIAPADAEKLTPQQIYQLIWEPGLSTAEKVTEVSGRGMGMDIVRKKIEDLSGTVELDSQVGRGSVFTIKLPVTLAILPSLLAEIDHDVFALPVESIVEIVHLNDLAIKTVHGQQTAVVRDRVVSIASLSRLFTWSQSANGGSPSLEDAALVVLRVNDQELGLIVHSLLGEEDIVIKSMAENYRDVEGIAGASILGDGRVALILDTAALLAMSQLPARQLTHA